MKLQITSALLLFALAACGGASGGVRGGATTPARGEIYEVGVVFDPGMSHVVITAVLVHDERVIGAIALGRFLNRCSQQAYTAISDTTAPPGTVLAVGCEAMADLAEDSVPMLVRVVERDGNLVGEWALGSGESGADWVVVGSLPVPAGGVVRPARADADYADRLAEVTPVTSCSSYPPSCGE